MKLSAESTSALVSSRTWSPVCTFEIGESLRDALRSSVCDTPSPATSMYSTCLAVGEQSTGLLVGERARR